MQTRRPYNLRKTLLIYNSFMVALNIISLFVALIYIDKGLELLKFDLPDKRQLNSYTRRRISLAWLYYITKLLDLFDTIFFVLRKKYSQITALHLYHHTSVPTLGWIALKRNPLAPPLLLFMLLNSFVHIFMYLYYALSAVGVYRLMRFKKRVTQLQLMQFAVLICYGCVLAYKQTNYPFVWFWIGFAQNVIFLVMFCRFYSKCYARLAVEGRKCE